MQKLVCVICNRLIRRPVDHSMCLGAIRSDVYLKIIKPKPSDTDITQEIDLRAMGFIRS